MKNRDLMDALSKLPPDADIYVFVEHRRKGGVVLTGLAIERVVPVGEGETIMIFPVSQRPKTFTRKGKPNNPITRHNRN